MKEVFDIILADPPWSYYGSTDGMGDVGKEYKTMRDEEVLAYRYPLASKNSILFLWATAPRLDLAIQCFAANNLFYRGVAFVWIKTKKDGVTPVGAMGVRASVTKPTSEFVLWGAPKKKGRPRKIADETVAQTILSPHVRTLGLPHSTKPDEVQARIERMYPDANKAEFFARRQREGWNCFGDEI